MFFKKKTPFVRFVNLIPGVEIAHPIIKSNEYTFDWTRSAALHYKDKLANTNYTDYVVGTARCPGILGMFKTGFIVTAPIDFTITTDDPGFEWSCPQYPSNSGQSYIDGHSRSQLSAYMPFREDTLSSIIKVNTFWRVTSSSDIVMLQLPIPYPDHNVFTAATGMVDCNENYHEVNIQLFWHKLHGTHHIKAGTPLCQLIPIPRNFAVNLLVEKMTDADKYTAQAYEYLVKKDNVKDLKSFFTNCKKLLKRN